MEYFLEAMCVNVVVIIFALDDVCICLLQLEAKPLDLHVVV